jgi:hypothetical protein
MKYLRMFFATLLLIAVAFPSTGDARPRVRIYKESPPAPAQPIYQVPLAAVPPIAVAFDLARRTSCDPRVAIGTGKGDPGFDPAGPTTGNWLVPAIYRSQCGGARPKWYKW